MRIVALLSRVIAVVVFASGFGEAAILSLDQNFHAPSFVEPSPAIRMTLLPDGKFVRFNSIATLVDQAAGPITRYLPDGTLDTSFQALTDYASVSAAAPTANGKLIVAAFQNLYSTGIERILRLNADGSIDATFAVTTVQLPLRRMSVASLFSRTAKSSLRDRSIFSQIRIAGLSSAC